MTSFADFEAAVGSNSNIPKPKGNSSLDRLPQSSKETGSSPTFAAFESAVNPKQVRPKDVEDEIPSKPLSRQLDEIFDNPYMRQKQQSLRENLPSFDAFAGRVVGEVKKTGKALLEHPGRMAKEAIPGTVMAGASAIGGMAEAAIATPFAGTFALRSAYDALKDGKGTADIAKAYVRGGQAGYKEFADKPVVRGAQELLTPETVFGKRLLGLIGLVPGATEAFGKGVEDMTGSKEAGLATEFLANAATFLLLPGGKKPKAKPGESTPIKPTQAEVAKGQAEVIDSFKELYAKDSKRAHEIADAIKDAKAKKKVKDALEVIEERTPRERTVYGSREDLEEAKEQASHELGDGKERQGSINQMGPIDTEQASANLRNTMRAAQQSLARMDEMSADRQAVEAGLMKVEEAQEKQATRMAEKPLGARLKSQRGAVDPSVIQEGLQKLMAGMKYTFKTLSRLPQDQEVFTRKQIVQEMGKATAGKAERSAMEAILSMVPPGEKVKAKDLADGFRIYTKDYELTPHKTEKWTTHEHGGFSDYIRQGYERLDRDSTQLQDYTMQWDLPKDINLPNPHFGDNTKTWGHTRGFKEHGVDHVVELQSDWAQLRSDPKTFEAAKAELSDVVRASRLLSSTKPYDLPKLYDKLPETIQARFDDIKRRVHSTDTTVNNIESLYQRLNLDLRMRLIELAKVVKADPAEIAKISPLSDRFMQKLVDEHLRMRAAERQNATRSGEAMVEGPPVVRFATGDTAALVEGWPRGADGTFGKYTPLYNRYSSTLSKYLKSIGGKPFTDDHGHTWMEVPLPAYGQPIYMFTFNPIRGAFDAIGIGKKFFDDTKTGRTVKRELKESFYQMFRNLNPEGLSEQAAQTAAIAGRVIQERMRKDSVVYNQGAIREKFWSSRPVKEQQDFLVRYDRGDKFSDPMEAAAADAYKAWNDELYARDVQHGLTLDYHDHYMYRLFEDRDALVQYFTNKYGPKWTDPRFTKKRDIHLLEDALKAGFRLKETNPEMVMQMREAASNMAESRIQVLHDMQKWGLSRPAGKKDVLSPYEVSVRAPNGEKYIVHRSVGNLLKQAFDQNSLWTQPGVFGAAFRGIMAVKNPVVSSLLSASLFHPIHVTAGMYNGSAALRISKELLAGTISPQDWIAQMGKSQMYAGLWGDVKAGDRLVDVYKGKVPEAELTLADKQAMYAFNLGGFVPEMSAKYKSGWVNSFRTSIAQHSAAAAFKAPFAMLEAIGHPMYEVYIPALKAQSYLKDFQSLIKNRPELLDAAKNLELMQESRKLMKSVENRFGQMNYDTLFINRLVKDIGIGSTLSMGWDLGFLREFVAGPSRAIAEAGKAIMSDSPKAALKEAAQHGSFDRALFAGMYTAITMAYGGLLTYAMTGKGPEDLKDYIYPRSGGTDANGNPNRVNTMFYTREFYAIAEHAKAEGVLKGMGEVALNKASPVFGMMRELFSREDFLGREITDSTAPWYVQLQQRIAHVGESMAPIPARAIAKEYKEGMADKPAGEQAGFVARTVAGFGPAPKYATESEVQGKIRREFSQEVAHAKTPFAKAQKGADKALLRKYYHDGNMDKFSDQLVQMKEKYHLSSQEMTMLRKSVRLSPDVGQFMALSSDVQTRLLKDMSEEERGKYLPHAKKKAKQSVYMEAQ